MSPLARDKDRLRDAGGIAAGAALIALAVPIVQWIDRGSVGNNLETDVVSPLGVGVLVVLAAVNALFAVLSFRRVPPRLGVIVYVMLSVSIPFANLGLVQGAYAEISGLSREYLNRNEDTPRRGYEAGSRWYFLKLDEADHELYRSLRDRDYVRSRGIVDPAHERQTLLKPVKRFWSGRNVDRETKAAYSKLGTAGAVRESWRAIPWRIWGRIIATWLGFFVAVLLGTMFLSQILHRDWTERENLPFPAAEAPLVLLGSGEARAAADRGEGRDGDAGAQDRAGGTGEAGGLPAAPRSRGRMQDGLGAGRQAGKAPVASRAPGSGRGLGGFFWGAMAVGAVLLLLSGLGHYRIADIPSGAAVSFDRIDLRKILTARPWSIVNNNVVFLSPLMVGLALMVHQDVLKGIVYVFFSLTGARMLTGVFEPGLSRAFGPSWPGNRLPYYPELATGAVAVFAVWLVWRSRSSLGLLLPRRKSAGPRGRTEAERGGTDAEPALGPSGGDSYFGGRYAPAGLLLCLAAVAAWTCGFGASGPMGVLVVVMVLLYTLGAGLAVARARAEAGLAAGSTNLVGDMALPFRTGGGATYGFSNMLVLCRGWFLVISAFPGLLASQMEGLFMGRRLGVRARTIAVAVAVAFVTAVTVGMVSYLVLSYWVGGEELGQRFQSRANWPIWDMFGKGGTTFATRVDPFWISAVAAGAFIMGALLWLRRRYPRFPVPPVCFAAVCLGTVTFQRGDPALHSWHGTEPVCFVWGPALVAYAVKRVVLRFGGMDLYARVLPAAAGLVISQALMVVFWNAYHLLFAPPNATVFTGVFQ